MSLPSSLMKAVHADGSVSLVTFLKVMSVERGGGVVVVLVTLSDCVFVCQNLFQLRVLWKK